MSAATTEIAEGIYRFSTYEASGPPGGITFNQFLVVDDEPLLIHTGMRQHASATIQAVAAVLPLERLRWITSNHASRPDELGALDLWFAAAPHAQVAHGEVACFVHVPDLTDRPARPMADGDVLAIGRRHLRWLATPHVPGPWEAGFWHDEDDDVLFTGDVLAQRGEPPATVTDDIVGPAIAHDAMGGTALTPATGPTLRRLADLAPTTLALMHGPTFHGDGATALHALAAHFDDALRASMAR